MCDLSSCGGKIKSGKIEKVKWNVKDEKIKGCVYSTIGEISFSLPLNVFSEPERGNFWKNIYIICVRDCTQLIIVDGGHPDTAIILRNRLGKAGAKFNQGFNEDGNPIDSQIW